jgi:glycosyltransferase involved in cell wall biosynthesis
MSKKKVLFIIDTLLVGGAEKSILEISRKLEKVQPVICTLFTKKPDLEDDYLRANIPVYKLGLSSSGIEWWKDGRKKLEAVIKQLRPSVIHAHLYKSEVLARTTQIDAGIPLVGAFVNDSYSNERYEQQSFLQNMKLNVYKKVDAHTAKKADYFTSITAAIADTNCRALNIPVNKVKVIYRGRDTRQFKISHPSYVAGKDVFIFQVVARLLKRKGYVELIDAIKILQGNGEHKFLVRVAGDGVDASFIKSKAIAAGVSANIDFLGNRNDVPDLLQQAHCFVFASHYEGQGGSLVEAMLSAKPIVATDIPVFKEQVQHGQTGRLFRLADAKDLAGQMLWMMDNYAEGLEMGRKALDVATKRFDIDLIAQQYDEFYMQILNKGK